MEHYHLQSAANRIWHAIDLVKGGQARLCHDHAIETRDGTLLRGAAKQLQYHRVSSAAQARCRDRRGKRDSADDIDAPAPATVTGGIMRCMNGPSPSFGRAANRVAVTVAFCVLLGGCFSETYQRGYIVPEGALEQIPIGSTQEQVLIVLGTPSTVDTVSGEAFYYISQRAERSI